MCMPSAATAVPSPHAGEKSSSACALTRPATGSSGNTMERYRFAVHEDALGHPPAPIDSRS